MAVHGRLAGVNRADELRQVTAAGVLVDEIPKSTLGRRLFFRLIGQPNLRELIAASAGVTYWLSSAKATTELGFGARDLDTGFRDTFGGA